MSKLCIIHTATTTVNSLGSLAHEIYPNIEIIHLMDDTILAEINLRGEITSELKERFRILIEAANLFKPTLILSACSSIGDLIEEANSYSNAPCFRIDLAMASEAVSKSTKITVAATVRSTLKPTFSLIKRLALEADKEVDLDTVLIEEAGALLTSGNTDAYEECIAEALLQTLNDDRYLVLAQASMATAVQRLPQGQQTSKILTSPRSGLESIASYLQE